MKNIQNELMGLTNNFSVGFVFSIGLNETLLDSIVCSLNSGYGIEGDSGRGFGGNFVKQYFKLPEGMSLNINEQVCPNWEINGIYVDRGKQKAWAGKVNYK